VDRPDLKSRQVREDQLHSKISRPTLEPTQPPVLQLFPVGVKRPGRETDTLPLSSVEVKAGESDMSTAVCVFITCVGNNLLYHIENSSAAFCRTVWLCASYGPTMNNNYTTKQHSQLGLHNEDSKRLS